MAAGKKESLFGAKKEGSKEGEASPMKRVEENHGSDEKKNDSTEGGSKGGRIVAAGTPEDVAATAESFTGQYLAPLLKLRPKSTDAAE